jgi:hypothetical protein
MPVVAVNSVGAILALLVLVVCVVALILIVVGQGAVLPAWLVILLIGCLAAARLT